MVEEILSVFPDAHISSGYARIRCPYHKDGHEHKPSMSILLEQKGNCPPGFCHCFACGKVTDINTLFSDVGADIRVETAASSQPQVSRFHLQDTQPVYKTSLPYRKSEYLESRGIGEDVQRKFKVYEKNGKVHMPVFDREGRFVYDNARSTAGKRFFVEEGARKTLWGIEEVDFSRPVAICESQIDAMSLWEVGMQAVATLGADNIGCLSMLKKCTSIILLAFDPDAAGFRARDRAVDMFGKFRCKYLELPEGVDVNQALQDIRDHEKFKKFMRKCVRDFVQ